MLVLHEGLIPSSKVYKICVLNNVEDIKILDIIFNKGIELIKNIQIPFRLSLSIPIRESFMSSLET